MSYDRDKVEIWSRNEPQFPGDVRCRPAALQLLSAQPGETILDAGCGSGYMTRKIAQTGANVIGCDVSEVDIQLAINQGAGGKSIQYDICDITAIVAHYGECVFDKILCCGVLMLCREELLNPFFESAYKALKPGGVLVTSVTHPHCYLPHTQNPVSKGEVPWLRLEPELPLETRTGRPVAFRERYMDCFGRIAETQSYNHFYLNHIIDWFGSNGFIQNVYWEKEDILSPHWEGPSGFPVWQQHKSKKLK